MKLEARQLRNRLATHLDPLYVISTDASVVSDDLVIGICDAAKHSGFTEIHRLTLDPSFDPFEPRFLNHLYSPSLFGEKKILIVMHHQSQFTKSQTGMLIQHLEKIPKDVIVILQIKKLMSKTTQETWFKTLVKSGVVIMVPEMTSHQHLQWIITRAKKNHLKLSNDAAQKLSYLTENNPTQAACTLDQLATVYENNLITQDLIPTHDAALFNLFDLSDAWLRGDRQESLRILRCLMANNTELTLIVWTLTRDVRTLLSIQASKTQQPWAMICKQHKLFGERAQAMQRHVLNHPYSHHEHLLEQLASIDRTLKGLASNAPAFLLLEQWLAQA